MIATNASIADRLQLHTKVAPYRTYVLAFAIARGELPDALYWDTEDPYHYVRLQTGPDDHVPKVEAVEGVLYLNPGSAGRRRFKLPITLATIEITSDGPLPEVHDLEQPER